MQKIAIHSVPRSGSTWLGNLFNSHPKVNFKYQPLFSFAFKDYLSETSSLEEIESFYKAIQVSEDPFINQKEGIEKKIIPVFKKDKTQTHSCYKEVRYHHVLTNMLQKSTTLKVILLIRNPLAVIHSWHKAPKEFKQEEGWVFEEEWLDAPKKNLNKMEEFNGYNKWRETALLFLKLKDLYSKQVYILKYSDLLNNSIEEVEKIFQFSNLNVSSQTYDFLNSSQSLNHKDAYSVYKKREIDDNWKQLPNHIIDYITFDLKNTNLEQFINE